MTSAIIGVVLGLFGGVCIGMGIEGLRQRNALRKVVRKVEEDLFK
jgi:hypothetical protein